MANPETSPSPGLEQSAAPKTRAEVVMENIKRMLRKLAEANKKRQEAPASPRIQETTKKLIENKPTYSEQRDVYETENRMAKPKDKAKWFRYERASEKDYDQLAEKKANLKTEAKSPKAQRIVEVAEEKARVRGRDSRPDARNVRNIEKLTEVNEEVLNNPQDQQAQEAEQQKIIRVAEGFVETALTTADTSDGAKEAREYLDLMAYEYADIPEVVELKKATERQSFFHGEFLENEAVQKLPEPVKEKIKQIETQIDEKEIVSDYFLSQKKAELEALKGTLSGDDHVGIDVITRRVQEELDISEMEHRTELPERDDQEYRRPRQPQNNEEEYGRYSSLYLDAKTGRGMIENPEWEVEQMLRNSRRHTTAFGSTEEDATKHKLQLMYGYIRDGAYTEHAKLFYKDHKESPLVKQFDDEDSFVKHIEKQYEKISLKINTRDTIQRAGVFTRENGDLEKVSQIMSGVGTGGFTFLLNENGGLVKTAFDRLNLNMKNAKYAELTTSNPDGEDRQRITATVRNKVRKQTIKELYEDRELYRAKYNEALNLDPDRDITMEDIEAMVDLAQDAMAVSQQDAVATMGGLIPGEGEKEDVSTYQRASPQEKIMAALDIDGWFFERYTMLKPGDRLYWDNTARFGAFAMGRDKDVDKMISAARGDKKALNKLAKKAFGHPDRMKTLLGMKKNGEPRDVSHLKSFDDLTEDLLREGLILQQGKDVLRHTLGTYTLYDSNVRNKTILQQLEDMYGKEEAQKMALGMRLRKAGAALLGASNHEKEHDAEHDVLHVLKDISKYRPQAVIEFLTLSDHDETIEAFKEWKHTGLLTGLAENTTIDSPGQMYHFIDRRFQAINEKLAIEGQSVIDYSAPDSLTPRQREIILEVCDVMKTDPEKYMKLMHTLSEHGGDHHHLEELTKPANRSIYQFSQFIDDARLDILERPNDIPQKDAEHPGGLVKQKGEYIPLSRRYSEVGRGSTDPFVTAWSDTNTGSMIPAEIYNSFTSDEKTNREQLKKVLTQIKMIGAPSDAAATQMLLGASWVKTWQTDPKYSALYLSNLRHSSPGRKLINEHGPSLGLNEAHHYVVSLGDDAGTNLQYLNEHVFHKMEQFIGMTLPVDTKIKMLNELPLWFYRGKLYIPLAGIILFGGAFMAALGELDGHKSSH